MSEDSMPYRLPEAGSPMVNITFEGETITARAADSVAAALIATGINITRQTPVSGSHRGPFCMMGVCFDCLTEINGIPNKQACMVRVSEGMVINRMRGARTITDSDGAQEQGDRT